MNKKVIGFVYDKRELLCIGKAYTGYQIRFFGWYLNEQGYCIMDIGTELWSLPDNIFCKYIDHDQLEVHLI